MNKAPLFEPGVVLLDMKMSLLDGHQVHQFLCQQQSTLAVVIMTAHADVPMAVQELKQGAVDFYKTCSIFAITICIKTATQTTQSHYERYKIRHCYAQLSRKELDILALLIQGCINRQIAEALNISVRTVEVHRSHIMEKCKRKLLLN